MSSFHETFDRTGVPPHIAYQLLIEALEEESTRSIFATQMHKTVSELARQGIDDEGNQIMKEETDHIYLSVYLLNLSVNLPIVKLSI